MSIQYLFIIDFEGRDILNILKEEDSKNKDLKELAKKSKRLCINEMKNKIIEYKKNLEKKNNFFKLFARKNGDMVMTGIITGSNYKDHNANSFIDKIFKLIKKYDLENKSEIKLLKKESIFIFKEEQKKLDSTKNILSKISEMGSKISGLQEKALENTKDLVELDLQVIEIKENTQEINNNAGNVKEEAKKYRNQLYFFIFGIFFIVSIIITIWLLKIVS